MLALSRCKISEAYFCFSMQKTQTQRVLNVLTSGKPRKSSFFSDQSTKVFPSPPSTKRLKERLDVFKKKIFFFSRRQPLTPLPPPS